MSIFEKGLIISSLIGVVGVGTYYTIKYNYGGQKMSRSEMYEKRLQLLEKENVKMLFSTLSFFYLQGYDKKQLSSYYTFYDMLHLAKPTLIALQLSEDEYQKKLANFVDSPKFYESMERVEYFTKIKSEELKSVFKGT